MLQEYLEAGRIVGTHGVRGELRVEPWCDGAAFLQQFHTLYWQQDKLPVRVLRARAHKSLLLLQLQGVDTLEQADALRGRVLCFRRADAHIPPGHWFQADIIGLRVLDAASGRCYGTVSAVYPTGANDVYEVRDEQGKTYLLPAIKQVLHRVDPATGVVEVTPMEGIFDAD